MLYEVSNAFKKLTGTSTIKYGMSAFVVGSAFFLLFVDKKWARHLAAFMLVESV